MVGVDGREPSARYLSPIDAKWLFDWTDPKLPDGWHAVTVRDDDPATVIVIH